MRAAARSSFDLLERTLAASRRLTPGQRLRHAGIVGRLRWRLAQRWPTTAEVRLLFDHLPPAEARRCAGKIAAGAARDRWVVATLSQRGIDVLRPLVATADSFATLRPPAVLTAFHVGGWNALGPGLEALSAPVLSLRQDALYDPPPRIEIATTHGDQQHRARVFQRAVEHLHEDGFVVATVDVWESSFHTASCLGGELAVARGPLALARLCSAPLVPVTAEWRSRQFLVEAHDPLAPPGDVDPVEAPDRWEKALASSTARWLETYLRSRPDQTGLGLLRTLATSPASTHSQTTAEDAEIAERS